MLQISENLRRHFKGFCSSPEIIMLFVYMKCRFSLSYRDLEEMAIIRGLRIDHANCTKMGYQILSFTGKRGKKAQEACG
jgi:putative transposase